MIDNDVVEIHVIDYGTYRESVTMDDDE